MIYNKINLFLPTYKRVKNQKLIRFINSAVNCADKIENIHLTFLVNFNDTETLEYLNKQKDFSYEILLWEEINKPSLGKMYNFIYENTKHKEGYIISMLGDDMEFQTRGYDNAIIDVINKRNGYCLVYCNDGFQKNKLCVNLFTTRKLVELTQFPFMYEKFDAYFIDTVWMIVSKKLKIDVYLNNIIIKHHHVSLDLKTIDETYARLKKERLNFKQGYNLVNKYSQKVIKNLKGVVL